MGFIRLENVERIYKLGKTEIKALQNVSCEINKGEMVALIGPSGSGKTTIINLVGTLDQPTSGKIMVDSVDITNLSPKEKIDFRKNKVSFVFQFFNLFPILNVFENVEFPLLFNNVSPNEIRTRVLEAIKVVGLGELGDRKIDELSGGQRQRVAIARALVTRAPIILADEPTANLDGKTALTMMELMKEINKQFETTFIFTTHDPRIMEYAHKIIELKDGKIENISFKKSG
ncbi:MAG: ABC transporter ATP-binding protein [Firmicutes bacterium]|nr:ABC transporter ATP-binding protein [Bacillota bacterium]